MRSSAPAAPTHCLIPAMEVKEVLTGFFNKHLTRKHLLAFPVISLTITLLILLFLRNTSAITKILKLGEAVTVDDQGVSYLTISPDSLVENLNAEFLLAIEMAISRGERAAILDLVLDEDFNLSLAGDLEGSQLISTTTGADPLTINSTDLVENLNAEFLGGYGPAYYLDAGTVTETIDISFLPDLSSLYLAIDGTAADSLLLAGENSAFYLNASNLNAGTVDLGLIPDLSGLYLSLSGGTLAGILDLDGFSVDSLGYITFSDGSIQSTAQATPATFVVCADDSQNTGRCDYVADGTADEVQIQAAISDLPTDGGKIVLLEGNYYISSPIILRSNLEISGMQGTTLHLTVRTNFFKWDEGKTDPDATVDELSDISIHDMEMDGHMELFSAPSSGDADKGKASAIKIFNSSRIDLYNLYIHDMEASYSILLKGRVFPTFDSGATDAMIHNNIFRDIGDVASAALNNGAAYSDHDSTIIQHNLAENIRGNGMCIDVASEGIIHDNILKNVTSTGDEGYAIVTGYDADNITIAGNNISGASRGIANHIGGGTTSDDHVIINNVLRDSPDAVDYAIKLQDSGHIVMGNRITNWDADAINLSGTTNSIISNNVISGIDAGFGVGINVGTGVQNVTIENNTIYDLGTVAQKGWGIRILADGDVTGVVIRNNRIYDSGAGVQGYGIFLQGVTATSEVQIEGNYLEGNIDAALTPTSALSSTVKAIRNRGFTTESSGTATVDDGDTFVDISHGLDTTPAIGDIKVTPTNDLGTAAKFWISDVGASTFRINVDADPGAVTATFSWSILIL